MNIKERWASLVLAIRNFGDSPVPLWAEFLPSIACIGGVAALVWKAAVNDSNIYGLLYGLLAICMLLVLASNVKSLWVRWLFISGPRPTRLRRPNSDPYPAFVRWGCADEGFRLRDFTLVDVLRDGRPEYACECGWLQASPRAGGLELLALATWNSDKEKRAFAELVAQQSDAPPGVPRR